MVKVMTQSHLDSANERVLEPMIALARCSHHDRIVVVGAKAIELMAVLQRRGYLRTAAAANCGRAAKQYNVAFVDWRQRPLRTLGTTLGWLDNYLSSAGVLVLWVDPQKPEANENLCATLQRYGYRVEAGTAFDYGSAIAARRSEISPVAKVA